MPLRDNPFGMSDEDDLIVHGWDEDRLVDAHAEFLVQVAATSETYADEVRIRSSYTADEVVWGSRFANIIDESKSGVIGVDVRNLGDLERLR